jgi:hypothetical protein
LAGGPGAADGGRDIGLAEFFVRARPPLRSLVFGLLKGAPMNAWFKKMVRHVKETSPWCLSGFALSPSHPKRWNGWVGWALACSCGANRGKLLGHPLKNCKPGYDGPPLIVSPLAFSCCSCGKTTEIIDTKQHGYNSAISKPAKSRDSNYRGTGKRQAVPCPECGEREFSIMVLCAHSNFDLIEDFPELEARTQEYFDSFNCAGICASCGKKSSLASFELA